MNPSIVKRLLFGFSLLACFTSCVIKPDGEITVTTDEVTNITESSADCGGDVYYTGGFTIGDCGVCYDVTSYPSYPDANYTFDSWGTGTFTSHLSGLETGTKYYVRAFAITSSGIMYGEQRTFTTKDGKWIGYCYDEFDSGWGLTKGGSDEWGIRFPSYALTDYEGKFVTKVKAYFTVNGDYQLRIYKGGYTLPLEELVCHSFTVSDYGWTTIDGFPSVEIDSSTSMWVTLACSYEAGVYPKCSSEGVNDYNARWRILNNGNWGDSFDYNGGVDICWMIKVLVASAPSTKSNSSSYGYDCSLQSDVTSFTGGNGTNWDSRCDTY